MNGEVVPGFVRSGFSDVDLSGQAEEYAAYLDRAAAVSGRLLTFNA